MAGFRFAFRESGGAPTVIKLFCKDTETLTRGDLANLESGEIDLAATADANLLGAIQQTAAGTDSTTLFEVIVDDDAVYSVVDNNARNVGDTLDISGATGAQTVAASSNKEFVVVRKSAATQPTLVRINQDAHAFRKAQ
jgi:galactitol-specific phosphotransferase system IIC component